MRLVESSEYPLVQQELQGCLLVNFNVVEKTRVEEETGEESSYYEYLQLQLPLGMSTEEVADKVYEAQVSVWKQQRQQTVDGITVTYNGVEYQGDETSQTRMSNAINGLPDDVTTVPWVAKDNTVHQLNKVDLKAILLDAGTQMTMMWNEGRPVRG